jgi:tellurite resistance protein TerC
MIWLWIGFLLFVTVMLALDLGVFHRKAHVISTKEALSWSAVWISMSLVFTFVVYVLYRENAFGVAQHDLDLAARYPSLYPSTPWQAAIMYLNGYLTEWSLSVDNIFVIAVIFAYFRIPAQYQHRVLFWGIIGAVVLRGVFILLGAGLIRQFHWTIYIFGAILLFTAIRLMFAGGEHDPSKSRIVRFIYRHFPVTDRLHGMRFVVDRSEIAADEHVDETWDAPDGSESASVVADTNRRGQAIEKTGRVLTPLGLALLVVEATDVIFAFDSIPAIFGITGDPFLVFTSNIFAILGLRSMYFALAGIIRKFHHLQTALALVLGFIALKMLLSDVIKDYKDLHEIMPGITFAVIILCIAGGIVASLLLPPSASEEKELELIEHMTRPEGEEPHEPHRSPQGPGLE